MVYHRSSFVLNLCFCTYFSNYKHVFCSCVVLSLNFHWSFTLNRAAQGASLWPVPGSSLFGLKFGIMPTFRFYIHSLLGCITAHKSLLSCAGGNMSSLSKSTLVVSAAECMLYTEESCYLNIHTKRTKAHATFRFQLQSMFGKMQHIKQLTVFMRTCSFWVIHAATFSCQHQPRSSKWTVLVEKASGVTLGAASGVTLGAASGVALGAASRIKLGAASGVSLGAASGVTLWAASGVSLRASSGVTLGAASGVSLRASSGVTLGAAWEESHLAQLQVSHWEQHHESHCEQHQESHCEQHQESHWGQHGSLVWTISMCCQVSQGFYLYEQLELALVLETHRIWGTFWNVSANMSF